jgi:hypothetical protein
MKGLDGIMHEDTIKTMIISVLGTLYGFLTVHLSEIQALFTFLLTVVFLVYKIREARAKALEAERHNEQRNRHRHISADNLRRS